MSDLIDRTALIADIDKLLPVDPLRDDYTQGRTTGLALAMERIKNAPSVLGTNLAEVGTDLISRQDAIDDIWTVSPLARLDRKWVDRWLRQLPSAQPKRGKWILDRSGAYCCSECMEPCAGYIMMKPRDKFCKMCGSRNEVTE